MNLRRKIFATTLAGLGITGATLYVDDAIEQSSFEGIVEKLASQWVQQSLNHNIERNGVLDDEGTSYPNLCSQTHNYLKSPESEDAERFSQNFSGGVANNKAVNLYFETDRGQQVYADFNGHYTVRPELAWSTADGINNEYRLVANLDLTTYTRDNDLELFYKQY